MGQAVLRQLVTRHRPSKFPLPVSEHLSGAAIYARTQEGEEGSRGDSPSLRSCVVSSFPCPYPQDSTGQTDFPQSRTTPGNREPGNLPDLDVGYPGGVRSQGILCPSFFFAAHTFYNKHMLFL